MSISRVPWLVASKFPRFLTNKHVRGIHYYWKTGFITDNYYHKENSLVQHLPKNLTNWKEFFQTCKRYKSSRKKNQRMEKQQDEESEDEDEDSDVDAEGYDKSKLMSMQVASMRIDLITKTCFGIARNKAETAFYESKIRINGNKILKKSEQVRVGDVVDLIHGPSTENPNFLVVSRVVLHSAFNYNDVIRIKFRRDKKLLIENYEEKWMGDEA